MQGVELCPGLAWVRRHRSAMFFSYEVTGRVSALLVGARQRGGEWEPAIETVTIEMVIVNGVKIAHGRSRVGRIGWPVFGGASLGQSFVVYVRNDGDDRELRVVAAIDGQGSPGPPRTGRTQRRIGR